MKEFDYTITGDAGIHARPAGELVKAAKAFSCDVKIAKDGKSMNSKAIFGVMSLGAKKGDTITMTFEGEDEDAACKSLREFAEKYL